MADAEAVCAGLPERADVRYTGLILNDRGYQRLRDKAAGGRPCGPRYRIPLVRTIRVCRWPKGLSMAAEIIADGRDSGFPVKVTIAVAFGCPFEGDVPLARIQSMAETLAAAGPVEIALADTIGVGVPMQVGQAFSALKQQLGELPLRAHFHDTRNTGIANAYAALTAGVSVLDASIGGIGGCPFAPNASGNIATEDLLYMLNRGAIEHGIDMQGLIHGAAWLETVLGKKVPSMLLKAGGFPD